MSDKTYAVQTIRGYLLSELSESETEQLDELSITDEDFADALRSAEHDLVDSYARGELEGVVLEQFRTRYLTSAGPRLHVRFAEALQTWGGTLDALSTPTDAPATVRTGGMIGWRVWMLAAAAVLVVTAGTRLAFENRTLRSRLTGAESARDALRGSQQARREPDASPAPATAPVPGREAAGAEPTLTIATLVLTPQLRSGSQVPTLALTAGSGDVAVQLDLEPVDYPTYEVSLTSSAESRELWRTDRLSARTVGSRKTLDVRVPAAQLGPQGYVLRVSGVPSRGAKVMVGEYRFTVVR